jgi:lipoate-protein ligase B
MATSRRETCGAYVHALESWIIAALARFGIKGEVREGRVGVWVQDPASGMEEKIAAIGVRGFTLGKLARHRHQCRPPPGRF